MHFKSYKDSIDLLRNRPVRPEFAEIRALVLDQSNPSPIVVGALPLPLVLSMVCFLSLAVFAHFSNSASPIEHRWTRPGLWRCARFAHCRPEGRC